MDFIGMSYQCVYSSLFHSNPSTHFPCNREGSSRLFHFIGIWEEITYKFMYTWMKNKFNAPSQEWLEERKVKEISKNENTIYNNSAILFSFGVFHILNIFDVLLHPSFSVHYLPKSRKKESREKKLWFSIKLRRIAHWNIQFIRYFVTFPSSTSTKRETS